VQEDSQLSPHSRVTPEERDVVTLLGRGCERWTAAAILEISESCLRGRLRSAMKRLGCATTYQLMFLLGREAGAAGRHR
jgi:DNA-binding NarL/FixJ family response regulator